MFNKKFRKILIIIIMGLFTVMNIIPSTGFLINNQSIENTLYVGGSGPGNYSSIQNAINDASNGDTIFVYSGTYFENIIIDKTINLIGQNRTNTVIDGSSQGLVINIHWNAQDVAINGFTVQNSGNVQYNCGIGVYSDYNTFIENTIIKNNELGIYLYTLEATVKNCIIEDNHIGIYSIKGYSVKEPHIITGNYIKRNIYGIFLEFSSYNVIKDNDISSNHNSGIFFNTYSMNNNITNNILNSNKLAGIHFLDSDNNENEVYDNTISNNNKYGILFGGDYAYGENSIKNKIIGNTINNNGKDGIQVDNSFWASIHENIISGNTINSNKQNGISLIECNDNIISGNTINSNGEIGISLIDSNENVISGNVIQNNPKGINILRDVFDGNNNIISGNSISENDYGIYIDEASSNVIKENNIFSNTNNAYFETNLGNKWRRNYWGRTSSLPYIIRGYRILFYIEYNPYGIVVINVDWFPAKEPYDIPIS